MNVSLLSLPKTGHKYFLLTTSYLIYFVVCISSTEASLLKLDECKSELAEMLVLIWEQDYEA